MPWRRCRPGRGRLRAAPISLSAPGRARRGCPTRWWPSTGCPTCSGIAEHAGGLRLAALVSHEEIVADARVLERYTAIADASAIVGSHATRHVGTIGGNVMNASPAMETGGPLICFGAEAVLASTSGERRVAVADLLAAPGRTSAGPDELLVAVELPASAGRVGQLLRAAGVPAADGDRDRRRHRSWSLSRTAGSPTRGSPSPRSRQPSAASRRPRRRSPGVTAGTEAVEAAAAAAATAAQPISDVRGSADYRRAMAAVIAAPGGHRRAGAGPRRASSRFPRARRCTEQAEEEANALPGHPERQRRPLPGRGGSGTAACSRCCAASSG